MVELKQTVTDPTENDPVISLTDEIPDSGKLYVPAHKRTDYDFGTKFAITVRAEREFPVGTTTLHKPGQIHIPHFIQEMTELFGMTAVTVELYEMEETSN